MDFRLFLIYFLVIYDRSVYVLVARSPLSVLSEVAICTEPTLRMQAVRAEVTEALTGILHFGSDDEELCALG